MFYAFLEIRIFIKSIFYTKKSTYHIQKFWMYHFNFHTYASLHLTPVIIVYILTAESAAGLDIRVGIILKQYKVNADYLNLPNFFWKCYTANVPQIRIMY